MKRMFIFFWFVLWLAAAAHAADFESPNYDRVSEILFPETRSWQSLDSLPSPEMNRMLQDRWLLRSIYLKTEQHVLMEVPECSFITRALYEHFDLKLFRVADLDGDGFADIVYCGGGECMEGYATVIWFGGKSGLAARSVGIIPFGLLRGEMGGLRRISCINSGCCGDVVDEYLIGDLGNPSRYVQVRVHKGLSLPEEMNLVSKDYKARRKLVLRLAPTKNDVYNAEYLPGAKGNIVAYFKDDKGGRWGLLIVDKASQALCVSNPDNIDVGWVLIK
jgi:hypothetical protein